LNDFQKAHKIIEEVANRNSIPTEKILLKYGGRFERRIRDEAIRKVRMKTRLTLEEISEIFGLTSKAIWFTCQKKEG